MLIKHFAIVAWIYMVACALNGYWSPWEWTGFAQSVVAAAIAVLTYNAISGFRVEKEELCIISAKKESTDRTGAQTGFFKIVYLSDCRIGLSPAASLPIASWSESKEAAKRMNSRKAIETLQEIVPISEMVNLIIEFVD